MQLERYEQITPEFLEQYRVKELDLSLEKFWGAVGCSTTRGLRYETGKHEIPEVVKRLLFLHYGAGIPTDCESEEFHDFFEALRNGKTIALSRVINLLKKADALIEEAAQ